MILREVRFRATGRCVQRCAPRRSPPIWFELRRRADSGRVGVVTLTSFSCQESQCATEAGNQRLMPVPTEPKRLRNRLYSTNVDNAFASGGRPTLQNATNPSIVYRVPVEDVQRSWSGFPFRRTRDSDHDRLNRRPPGDGRVDAEIVAFDVFWRI